MPRIGAYDAKTHLGSLLDRVSRGESFTITKHGRDVAVLAQAPGASTVSVDDAIAGLRRTRKSRPLGAVTIRDLIDDGRRT